MKFTFQFTRREYNEVLRLNRQLQAPRWLGYFVAILCLLPSGILISFLQSQIILVAFVVMIMVVVLLFSIAFFGQPALFDDREHTVTLSDQTIHELHGHSEYEVNLRFFDEFGESADLFWFRKLDHHLSIPKRAVPPELHDRIYEFGAMVEEAPSESTTRVALFDRTMAQVGTEQTVKFVYQQHDVDDALKEQFVILGANPNPPVSPRQRKHRFFLAMWLIGIAAYGLAHLFSLQRQAAPPSLEPWGASQYLVSIAAIVLPFALLKSIGWLFKNRRPLPRVPDDDKQIWLLENGLAIGNASGISVHDWRDVESFYQNSIVAGYKTRGGLFHLIPKRIFSDPQAVENFLSAAMALHRDYQRRFAEPVVAAVETGNPYQAP